MKEKARFQLVNPSGVIEVEALKSKPHPETLEGKTVLLHWNSKHNGDVFLSRIAELLVENVKGVKIVKGWEVVPETAALSSSPENSKAFAKKLARFKPDISIGSQAD